ncbi:MAG TPA: DUF2202 domain-containing protein, partial [Catalimonadaceae bacterium]|nr:DUF2202 domain-containing protein [Catalimonadaceae bacterium]
MKNILILILFASTISISCKKENVGAGNDPTAQINAYPKEPLSADETASLLMMREEEKLAHDVYMALGNKWGTNIYSNIASSEQSHTNAVLTLIQKYNLTDPVGSNPAGVFRDSTLQTLYNQLVAKGSLTALDGFKIGATIEDLDIYDLNNWSSKTDNQDIRFVYQNLTKGSRNHLRSFYSQITGSGGSYTAQYLTQSELEAIINSPKETGSWEEILGFRAPF